MTFKKTSMLLFVATMLASSGGGVVSASTSADNDEIYTVTDTAEIAELETAAAKVEKAYGFAPPLALSDPSLADAEQLAYIGEMMEEDGESDEGEDIVGGKTRNLAKRRKIWHCTRCKKYRGYGTYKKCHYCRKFRKYKKCYGHLYVLC